MIEITEAIEASNSLAEALERLKHQIVKYKNNEETYNVVFMYEQAALFYGATVDQIENLWHN